MRPSMLTGGARAKRRIDAIADAAARWRDADFPPRVRATRAIVDRTAYTEPVVDYALDRLFAAIDRASLEAVVVSEVGSIEALDGFARRDGRPDVFFRAAGRVVVIASDTTIGVAIAPLVFALVAGCEVAVKDRSDLLVRAFAETIVEEEPTLATRVEVDVWDSAGARPDDDRIARADVVVAFARDATLARIRASLAPGARFVPFGHRTSVAYVGREALADATLCDVAARDAARDAILYDGDGCLSTHLVFVERGGAIAPERFAAAFARACDTFVVEFPPGDRPRSSEDHAYRKRARFRATQRPVIASEASADAHGGAPDASAGAHVIASETSSDAYVIAYDEPVDEPPPFFPRAVAIRSVAVPDDALAYLRRHALPLEGFARRPVDRPDLEAVALASGATYLAHLGGLQDPPLGGEHGGEGRILPFVRAIYRT